MADPPPSWGVPGKSTLCAGSFITASSTSGPAGAASLPATAPPSGAPSDRSCPPAAAGRKSRGTVIGSGSGAASGCNRGTMLPSSSVMDSSTSPVGSSTTIAIAASAFSGSIAPPSGGESINLANAAPPVSHDESRCPSTVKGILPVSLIAVGIIIVHPKVSTFLAAPSYQIFTASAYSYPIGYFLSKMDISCG